MAGTLGFELVSALRHPPPPPPKRLLGPLLLVVPCSWRAPRLQPTQRYGHCLGLTRYTGILALSREKILEYRQRWEREKCLFNDALNTFYLRLYGVRHMVKDHSDSEKGNPLPPHRLLLSINSKGSFICTIPQTG